MWRQDYFFSNILNEYDITDVTRKKLKSMRWYFDGIAIYRYIIVLL